MRNPRAWQQEPTKKGKLPSLVGTHLGSDIEINLRVANEGHFKIGPYGINAERAADRDRLLRSVIADESCGGSGFGFMLGSDPPQREMSRFLAKMALEALWLRFSKDPTSIKMLIDSEHHDRIRFWARRGDNFASWPFHQRRIFSEETLMRHPSNNSWVRVGFSYDLFLTKRPETYFAFCLFGIEYVINLGGPSIKGYEEWLVENSFQSPLIERAGRRLTTGRLDGEVAYFLDS